jgi:thrombospondin type 3 repeat protein
MGDPNPPPRTHGVPQRHLGEDPDSDGDGLSDEFERRWGSNPNAVDPDRDGLSDWVEWNLDTKPNDRDSDGDGWEDGEDLAFGDPLRTNTGGAERKAFVERVRSQFAAEGTDRDGDLVRDYVETQEGTRSDNPDSDGDGRSDLTEIQLRNRGVSTSQHSTPDD